MTGAARTSSVVAAGPGTPVRTVLSIRNLSKTFLGQRALSEVDFDLRAGEVHALLGQNGCGKSTLIKCLAGYHEPDPGAEFRLDDRLLPTPYQPADATRAGLVFVHQDLGLIPNLSVAENFAISRSFDTKPLRRIHWKAIATRAVGELRTLGHDFDPRTPVGRLSVAEQTIVAIARALASAEEGAKVLVLDEPTAALPDARRTVTAGSRNEVDLLFAAVRKVVAGGVGVIYVSHKLHEIIELADRATTLRDGRLIGTVPMASVSERDLVKIIVGREVATLQRDRDPIATGERLLQVNGLSGRRVRDMSFAVSRGEVIGVAGMLGSGRSELARLLFGAQQPTAGTISMGGGAVRFRDPRGAVHRGIALIPEDRRGQGGQLQMSVAQNLMLPAIGRYFRRGRLAAGALRDRAAELIDEYQISPADPTRKFGVLSGGNQQKVVIGKWLGVSPELVIFDEPVQGVDVGARAEIYRLVIEAARRGAGVLLISSELDHLLDLCNRVLVVRDGRLIADLPAASLTRHQLTHYIYFGEPGDAEEPPADDAGDPQSFAGPPVKSLGEESR